MNEWGRRWRRMLIRFSLGGLVYRLLSLTFALLAFSLLASHRPRRLARPRTSPFHGGNAGSNPAGDANILKDFRGITVVRSWSNMVRLRDGASEGQYGKNYDDDRNHRCGTYRKPDRTTRGGKRLQRCDQQFARTGDLVGAHRRAWSKSPRGDRRRGSKGGRHCRRFGAAEELPEGSGRAPGGQDRDRHRQLLP